MPTVVTVIVAPSGGDYTSVSAAIAGEARNLVALDEQCVIECEAFVDTSAFDVNGFNTDATRNVVIRNKAGHGHGGVKGAGYVCRLSSGTCRLRTPNTVVDGLEVEGTHASSSALIDTDSKSNLTVRNSILHFSVANTASNVLRLFVSGSSDNVIENVLVDGGRQGILAGFNSLIRNCSVFNYSFRGVNTSSVDIYNLVLAGGTSNNVVDGSATTENIAADFLATYVDVSVSTALGVDFVDFANGEYSPAIGGALDGAGTDLSAFFTDDIAGNTRTVPWDIGAFAVAVGGGSTVEAALSSDLSAGYSLISEASLETAFSGDLSASYTAASVASMEAAKSAGVSVTLATSATAQAESALSFALSVSDAVSALATGEAAFTVSQTLSDAITGQTQAGGEIEGSVSFSAQVAALATADAAALATIASGIEAAGNMTAIVAIPSAISASASLGSTAASFVGIGSSVSAGILAGAQATGEAQAYAAVSVDQTLATNLIAEAMAEAGLSVSSVQNVTFVGASISGDAVTPDGRRFRVALDLRTFEVSLETRSFKADQE